MVTLLEKLKAGTANVKSVQWPGAADVTVELRVLNDQDQLEASMAADRMYRDANINVGMANIADYEAEKTTQLLWRAVRDPVTGKRLTDDIVEWRRLLTKPVREHLVLALNELTEGSSPRLDTMSDEELDALCAQVKKTPKMALSLSNISTLKRLCTCLAGQLASSPTDNGST